MTSLATEFQGPRTMAEKILLNHAVEVEDGFVVANVDFALGHDATTALLIDRFKQRGLPVWDPSKVMLVADHFSPPPTEERAGILRRFLDFAKELEGVDLRQHEGICHQLMVEDPRLVPGALAVGADSHTTTAGALGCLATGVGSTDMLRILVTGTSWFRIPETIKVEVKGKPKPHVLGRDVALQVLGQLGEEGGNYKSLEFYDLDGTLTMDDRFSIANAAVEAGAKCGIVLPDAVTQAYLEERGSNDFEPIDSDAGATFERVLHVDLDSLEAQVATPPSPCNAVPVQEVQGTQIQRAYVGSCASGRLSDLRLAAEALAGETIHERVQLVVIPSSRKIYLEALEEGLIEIFVRSGAQVAPPSCGPCGGITSGILGEGEVCISSSTRNYPGRMGHVNSRTYLASARTVAVSAVRGEISA